MRYTIEENCLIAPRVYRLGLRGDTESITAPGQFLQLQVPGFFLRRPLSICDWEIGKITVIYKVVGEGTQALSTLEVGRELDALPGLGNGFDCESPWQRPLIVGGGVGVPPLYGLTKRLLQGGVFPTVVMGFNRREEIFMREEFEALGVPVYLATADGSEGTRGFVTDAIAALRDYDGFYACGPEPMLRAVAEACPVSGQLSFEERMACGFGACMGCSCKTKYGNKRICKDGPVLKKEEVIW